AARPHRRRDRGTVRPQPAGRAPRRRRVRARRRRGVADASEGGGMTRNVRAIVPPLATAVVVLLVWHLAVVATGVAPYLLPAPDVVAREAWAHAGDLLAATFRTATAAVLALAGSIAVGLAVAFVFSQSRTVARSLYPYAIFLQTVPIVAIAPL